MQKGTDTNELTNFDKELDMLKKYIDHVINTGLAHANLVLDYRIADFKLNNQARSMGIRHIRFTNSTPFAYPKMTFEIFRLIHTLQYRPLEPGIWESLSEAIPFPKPFYWLEKNRIIETHFPIDEPVTVEIDKTSHFNSRKPQLLWASPLYDPHFSSAKGGAVWPIDPDVTIRIERVLRHGGIKVKVSVAEISIAQKIISFIKKIIQKN